MRLSQACSPCTPRAGRARARGFSIVELMVVVAIIAILTGMVVSGIYGVSKYRRRAEAKLTMDNMATGMISMKRNYEYDAMIPIGVYTGGVVAGGTNNFSDSRQDFAADGIDAGCKLYILTGDDRGEYEIASASGDTITCSGDAFGTTRRDTDYFIIKTDDELYPLINLAKELQPNNSAWSGSFTPHLNSRKNQYYTCNKNRIKDGEFVDPWGSPYLYLLSPESGVIVEKIVSFGEDGEQGTSDDIEKKIAEIPFGG